ncbi:MAG: hypothetical protein KJ559_03365 [Nanoarchaeota archaeon]|nr:hypothetical protein [Nanoarchaeota archaeon]
MEKESEENEEEVEEKETEEKTKEKNNKKDLTEKLRENPWVVSTVVLGIICLILLITSLNSGITGNIVSEKQAGENLLSFAKAQGVNFQITEIKDNFNLYEVMGSIDGEILSVYITKDGKNLVQGLTPLSITQENVRQTPQEIKKSDKPVVELFVMTHCPYGTQAEKGIIPVFELLGNKINSDIRFVHYFMHGDVEEQETNNQVCIREEQNEKYLSYMRCFLEAGETESCLAKSGINKAKLEKCISEKAETYYGVDSGLSNQYGVGGSPTLVINNQIVDSGRSSAAYLNTICSAFNKAPEECSNTMSSENPSPMWGWSASGNTASSGGSC